MKLQVLAIGNSFSQDATRYIHQIARAAGDDITVANLYIPGCSLERHYRNMLGNIRDYKLEYNGELTGFFVTIQEALTNRQWDVITLQQASHFSAHKDSYHPYIEELAAYVRKYQPKAKILIHQTWGYENESPRLLNVGGFPTMKEMTDAVCKAYDEAAKSINADGIIESGKMLLWLAENGAERVHRDTYHASHTLGRYALALLWYRALGGENILDNPFDDMDFPTEKWEFDLAKKYVSTTQPVI